MAQGKIIAVANQKGGVAKTTTCRNLAYSLGELGYKVLAVDFDAQANLTTCFGIENPNEIKTTIAQLMSKSIDEEELPPKSEYIMRMGNADLIPCCILLSVVDANLRSEMGSEKLLANILDPLRSDYDYIIIDTSPSLGALTINALSAADTVIITVNPQLLAVMGLEDLTKTILKIKRRINPRIGFEGILLTMCDTRTNLYKEISAQVGEAYRSGMRIFDSQIPSSVKVGEANRYGMSVMEYDKKSKAGLAYMDFAKELTGYAG